jgi:hypothetical protein
MVRTITALDPFSTLRDSISLSAYWTGMILVERRGRHRFETNATGSPRLSPPPVPGRSSIRAKCPRLSPFLLEKPPIERFLSRGATLPPVGSYNLTQPPACNLGEPFARHLWPARIHDWLPATATSWTPSGNCRHTRARRLGACRPSIAQLSFAFPSPCIDAIASRMPASAPALHARLKSSSHGSPASLRLASAHWARHAGESRSGLGIASRIRTCFFRRRYSRCLAAFDSCLRGLPIIVRPLESL